MVWRCGGALAATVSTVQRVRELTTTRRWLVLPIESNVRELDARVLLAAVAAERGFGVVIGRQAELPRYLPSLPPSVVLQMNAISTDVFDLARKLGHVVAALDEEGLVYRDQGDYLRRRISVAALERCERFFAWGNNHKEAVASKVPHLSDRIVAVGSSRLDLLRPQLRELYRDQADDLWRRFGRFVLVDSNFGTYNHRLGADHVRRLWKASGWAATERSAVLLERTLEFQRSLLIEFAELIKMLAAALPQGVRVVLRPHPAERHETWADLVGRLDNVTVIHQGGAVPWIMSSEAVVHNSCTTGIEAVLLGRPSLAYLPFRDEVVECALPNNVSEIVESRAAAVDRLLHVIGGGTLRMKSFPPFLSEAIANLRGRLASEVMADHFEAVAPAASAAPSWLRTATAVNIGRAVVRVRTLGSAIRHRNLRGERQLRGFVRAASPGIASTDVDRLLRALSSSTGRFQGISCAPLAPDLVVVGREMPRQVGDS